MKKTMLKLAAVAAVLMTLGGCIVLSVYPFYTEKDLVFDGALLGTWADTGKDTGHWQFASLGGKSYLLTTSDDHDTNGFEAHLFHLKRHQFLDLLTTNRAEFEMPMHLISEVTHDDSKLSLRFMDYGWLAALLETNPGVLPHVVVPMEPGDTNGNMFYLTAETKDLQKFLLQHADDTNAFDPNSTVNLRRASQ